MYPRSRYQKANFILDHRSGFVSRKPYIIPTPYWRYGGHSTYSHPPSVETWTAPSNLGAVQGHEADASALATEAYARAYDKLMGRVKGEATAMVAVNVLERQQSFDMIAKRAGQLLMGVRQLRTGNLRGFLKTFGISRKKTRKSDTWVRTGKGKTFHVSNSKVDSDSFALQRGSKTAGSLWLEYWLGWAPSIADVFNAVEVLQSPPQGRLRTRFSATYTSDRRTRTHRTLPFHMGGGFFTETSVTSFGVRLSCRAEVTSPNLFQANRLGLVNPATVAFELIPLSFVLNWFVPVQRYLESYTDTVGLRIWDTQRTDKRTSELVTQSYAIDGFLGHHVTKNTREVAFHFRRQLLLGGLPLPGVFDRNGTGISSWTRAATSVSLLTGYLKTSKWG